MRRLVLSGPNQLLLSAPHQRCLGENSGEMGLQTRGDPLVSSWGADVWGCWRGGGESKGLCARVSAPEPPRGLAKERVVSSGAHLAGPRLQNGFHLNPLSFDLLRNFPKKSLLFWLKGLLRWVCAQAALPEGGRKSAREDWCSRSFRPLPGSGSHGFSSRRPCYFGLRFLPAREGGGGGGERFIGPRGSHPSSPFLGGKGVRSEGCSGSRTRGQLAGAAPCPLPSPPRPPQVSRIWHHFPKRTAPQLLVLPPNQGPSPSARWAR